MKHTILGSMFLFAVIGCQHKKNDVLTENLKKTDLNDTTTFVTIDRNVVKVRVPHPAKKQLKTSALIEEFKYIPIETADSALMGQYKNIHIFDNRICIQDVETRMAYLFDIDGKYINKIGKTGRGPGEMIRLTALTVDPFNRHLVAYDAFLDKLFYFTLDGQFLFTKQMSLRSNQNIRVITPNRIAFGVNRTEDNSHIQELEHYNILYTDSALNVLGGTLPAPMNFTPRYSPTSFSSNQDRVGYTPLLTPDFFEFTEDTLVHKYHFDYVGFDKPFVLEDLNSSDENGDNMDFLFSSTRMLPPILFTDNFLWFKTQTPDVSDEFYSYYDKFSDKMISFRPCDLEYDTEFRFASVLTAYEDYLVGYVQAAHLLHLKENYDKSNRKMDPAIADMIDNLQSDDNDILVFFKLSMPIFD